MNPQPAPAPVLVSNEKQSEAETQLHGHWPVLAWLLWLAVVIPLAVTFLAGLPGYRETLYRSNLIYSSSFQQLAISVDFFASYSLVVIVEALVCWSVAALVLWRKGNDWMGLLTALMLVLLGMRHVDLGPILGTVKPYLGFVCLFLFFCLFPNGRFVPRFLLWVLPLMLVWEVFHVLNSSNLVLLGEIGFVLLGLAAQVCDLGARVILPHAWIGSAAAMVGHLRV